MAKMTDAERELLAAQADDPQSPLRRAETESVNRRINEIIAGHHVRTFCVENAVRLLDGPAPSMDRVKDVREVTNFFYAFMTADLGKVPDVATVKQIRSVNDAETDRQT